MNSARIAELLEPFLRAPVAAPQFGRSEPATVGPEPAVLSAAQLHSISTYIDILIRWNARINLTAVRDPEEIVTRHFGESLFAARHLFPHRAGVGTPDIGIAAHARPARSRSDSPAERGSAACTLADLGSGAGFPGLPIKLWAPHLALTLIESNHKKAAFLREVARALTLTDVNIQNTRAETLSGKTFNVVILRAVERFESILPIAAALVAPDGRLGLLIGVSQQSRAQASLPQFTWSEAVSVPSSRARIILTGHQTGT